MLDFTKALTPASAVRYVAWKLTQQVKPLPVRLRTGPRFLLRSDTSENNDYGVAYEVFIHDYYRLPPEMDRSRVRTVVDLGGNVGMSVLHWLNEFPSCSVEVWEPNPAHVAQMHHNLALSDQPARVVVHQEAAGARTRVERFASLGTSTSAHVSSDTTFDAQIVDVLDRLKGRRIDLLKMDIEGGEYELLADPRFAGLEIGALVMEWHAREDAHTDRHWCEMRLMSMGLAIRPVFTERDHGMFWAVR